MRKDYCDMCGKLLTKRIIHIKAYTEGENIKHKGFGHADYFIELEVCDECKPAVVKSISDSLEPTKKQEES